ncbi:hypothetical protein C2G38_218614 [Gigaspora rosea]|uniref:Uncharacterized protein n=1 Tax=Gigaspora rosea TaxID=44941 RepID=A0A397UKN0_9GLOM|nr:hypothetical protein C2G38_218614 [Gigaspora rosea]
MGERNLEKEIHRILRSSSKLREYNIMLRDKCIKQDEDFDQERKRWDRERNKWGQKLGGANTKIQKLRTHDLELISETRRLQIENARKDISLAESKAKHATKLEEIKSLRNEMKLLKGKLDLFQKDSSKKGSEIESLKSKIVELALKISELERLKSEDISGSIIGGDGEGQSLMTRRVALKEPVPTIKNITKSVDIPSKDLSQYFVRDKSTPISEESVIRDYALSPRVDTEIIPKVSDEIGINESNNNILQEIPNMTPYLAQPENNSGASAKAHMSSLIESNSQMTHSGESLIPPIGGIGAIPIVASTLMSPLSAYIFLILLIIVVMWFVVLRRTWGFERESDRLRDMWIG